MDKDRQVRQDQRELPVDKDRQVHQVLIKVLKGKKVIKALKDLTDQQDQQDQKVLKIQPQVIKDQQVRIKVKKD